MKIKPILFLIFAFPFLSTGQDVMLMHSNNGSMTVFADQVNLREKPNLDSKTLAKINRGAFVESRYESRRGNVKGKKGNWIKVHYKGKTGYVWEELLANCDVKSQDNISYRFVIDGKEEATEIQIYYEGRYENSQTIPNSDALPFSSAYSIGKTYNSQEQDVFVFYFGNYKRSRIQLYSWNGKVFSEFNKPLKDSSFLDYKPSNKQVTTEDLVNFRTQPAIDSKIISVLKFNTNIKILNTNVKWDTVNNKVGSWAKIKKGKDTGYVWQKFISLYAFESYKEEALSFILKNSQEGRHEILAIRDNKIAASHSFDRISNFIGAHSRGSMGMKGIEDIIGVCYSGESCGVPSGDVLLAWDGKEFHDFTQDYGVGDGGLSYGSSPIFPSSFSGQRGIIKITSYDSESIDLYREDKSEDKYGSINREYLVRNYKYENWKLKEIDSETKKIEKLLSSKFPFHKLNYFEKGDLNQDGLTDVILSALDTGKVKSESYYNKPNKTLILIALKNKNGHYSIKTYSDKIVEHKDNSPLTEVKITPSGFTLNVYYSGYYNDENNPKQYYMDYSYDKRKKEFKLTKTTEIFQPSEYSGSWEKKEYRYTKNKLLFKDSYHPEWE